MRTAFVAYARDHEAASIRRCWSSWNVLCTFLYTGEQRAPTPMQLVGRPSWLNRSPRPSPHTAVQALPETIALDRNRSTKPTSGSYQQVVCSSRMPTKLRPDSSYPVKLTESALAALGRR
jgi:hypothetical protein